MLLAIVLTIAQAGSVNYGAKVNFVDPANSIFYPETAFFSGTSLTTFPQIIAGAEAAIISLASGTYGFTITSNDIIWSDMSPMNRTTNFSPGRSLVTGTGATGFQISATRDSMVNYNATIVTTSTIASGQDGTVVLEIAPTNSAVSSDWKEVARCRNGQVYSLAIALQGVQTNACALPGFVPAGYYAKVRTVQNTGAPSFTYNSGQETLQ